MLTRLRKSFITLASSLSLEVQYRLIKDTGEFGEDAQIGPSNSDWPRLRKEVSS